MTYVPKRTPWAHQKRGFDLSHGRPYFAYFMEQRTGKTTVCLDDACASYEEGAIDAIVVLAPSGVHRNWIADEVPKVVPDRIKTRAFFWRADRHGEAMRKAADYRTQEQAGVKIRDSKAYAAYRELREAFAFPGLAIVSINVEALRLQQTRDFLKKFLAHRTAFSCADESTVLKSPGSLQSKLAETLGRHSAFRRILDGTPLAESPMDAYAQCRFLSKDALGFQTFALFKARYGEYETNEIWVPGKRPGEARQQKIEQLVGYKNLDELQAKLDSFSFRVLRRECADLPPTLFRKRYVPLTDKQRRLYEKLREEDLLELAGKDVPVRVVLTKYVRLQQILSNYLPPTGPTAVTCPSCRGTGCGDCDETGVSIEVGSAERIDDRNPRMDALLEEVLACRGQVVIWSRFKRDRDEIGEALTRAGVTHCRYDGTIGDDQKYANKIGFQAGDYRVLNGDAVSAGRGLDFSAAELAIYYTNRFSNLLRQQSQDRMESVVNVRQREVVDFVAEDTVDEIIVYSNLAKHRLSEVVMGDANRGLR